MLPLPWLEAPLRQALATRHAHALLIHGPQGIGQFELALTLAQAWLCEGEAADKPCGRCASCKLVQARSHPDLLVLLPEALRESLGWAGADDADSGGDDKGGKRKPSKEIRVDEIRQAIGFAQTTSARGRCKVVLIHPAERMNGVSANALLKTLEEPPGEARLLLSCAAPDALLPTIRSRCQA
ncbi:MAG TPA: DNA polymerase III subunit delta', partial [Albitalea sp.]|nr:DNA polymerase III subunit delta' [Albitalea sp.]